MHIFVLENDIINKNLNDDNIELINKHRELNEKITTQITINEDLENNYQNLKLSIEEKNREIEKLT
jgi:peptidoglycan hydrolase CwlO-like protein